jgi:hypothetical protein
MKQHLSRFLCSALLGVAAAGFSLAGTAQAQTAGSLAVPLIAPAGAEATIQAEPVNHRERRYYRDYRRHGGGGGIYFNFGNGSFSLTVPPQRYYPRQRRHYGYPQDVYSRHVNWCYNRYRSYRHWDNTFQPYHGQRQQCWSPYN